MRYLVAFFVAILIVVGYITTSPANTAEKSKKWMAEYKEWGLVTDFRSSFTHWGMAIRTYTSSDTVYATFAHNYEMEQLELEGADMEEIEEEGGYRLYPVGAVLAKENFKTNGDGKNVLDTISFMEKRAKDDWYYLHVKPDGTVLVDSDKDADVAQKECITCHNEVEHRDYIYHTFFDATD